jgi:biopolymer transport protein ExbD
MQLNTEPVSEDALVGRLLDVFKTRNERGCFVKGDPDLEFQYVAKAIDLAKGAQLDKVGLMTAKIEAGE